MIVSVQDARGVLVSESNGVELGVGKFHGMTKEPPQSTRSFVASISPLTSAKLNYNRVKVRT